MSFNKKVLGLFRNYISHSSFHIKKAKLWRPATTFQCCSSFHTSSNKHDLMEFFDDKDHWGENKIDVGRPWRLDELRIKGNTDLHKLWYVLLKERNMIMTMEAEYENQHNSLPSSERLEKVEESMENVLEVIQERDRAYNLLETGETGEPEKRWVYNVLGEGYWRNTKEYTVPMQEYKGWLARSDLPSTSRFKWAEKYKKLYREKQHKHRTFSRAYKQKKQTEIEDKHRDSEID